MVVDDKVYVLGAEAHLCCLDARTGNVLWFRELKKDYQAKTPMWGFAGHPLVDGQKIICTVGGKDSLVVALDKDTEKSCGMRWTPARLVIARQSYSRRAGGAN